MAGNFKRTKASADVVGTKAIDLSYNDVSGAVKQLGPIIGKLKYIGALSTAKYVEQGKLMAVYNTAATTGFIGMSVNPGMAAPTDPTNGFPCRPLDYTIFATGSDTILIGSAGTLFAYEILDESSYSPNQ
jgi:hypothetical protein